ISRSHDRWPLKGHRNYYMPECKAIAQERPYKSRPSRTQQLFNPKLLPKLTNDAPQDLLRKYANSTLRSPFLFILFNEGWLIVLGVLHYLSNTDDLGLRKYNSYTNHFSRKGVADEQIAKAEQERERKRERQSETPEITSKRRRSASISSVSVSTISTTMSRSPSPRRSYAETRQRKPRSPSMSRSPALRKDSGHQDRRYNSISQSPQQPRVSDSEKKRRRGSVSSVDSDTSADRKENMRPPRDSRSTRRRFREVSPPVRGRRTESRSPHRGRGRLVDNHEQQQPPRNHGRDEPPRERSLSPFSKRLALTQAMNMGR
ncbi:hypothetical protein HYALB_00006019, partial [Hymenoscyphus albidus]